LAHLKGKNSFRLAHTPYDASKKSTAQRKLQTRTLWPLNPEISRSAPRYKACHWLANDTADICIAGALESFLQYKDKDWRRAKRISVSNLRFLYVYSFRLCSC
jgi:hypothetical protein